MRIIRLGTDCVGLVLGPDLKDNGFGRVLVFLRLADNQLTKFDVFERSIARQRIEGAQMLTFEEAQEYLDYLVTLTILGHQTLQASAVLCQSEKDV